MLLTGQVTTPAGPLTGTLNVSVTPRATQVPPEFYDGQDATDRLSAWLGALAPGTVVQFDPVQDIVLQRQVKVSDIAGLTIRDFGTARTVPEWSMADGAPAVYTGAHLWFLRCSNLRVEGRYRVRSTNTVTDGAVGFGAYNAERELAAAFRAEFSPGLRIAAKLDVDGVWGDCIQLVRSDDFDIALDPAGFCDRNGRQGITPLGIGGKVSGFRLLHGRRAGFDLEPFNATPMCGDIEISDYDVNTRLLPFASGGAGPVNNVYIHDGRSSGAAVPVFSGGASNGATRRSNWRIERHVSAGGTASTGYLGSPLGAVSFRFMDDVSLTDCRFPVHPTRSHRSVDLNSCGGQVTITGNDFGPGGTLVTNTTPMPDLTLTVQPDQQVV